MTRRLYQNWGVASVREVARTKLEARRWITDVGGNPCASAYALVRADRCAAPWCLEVRETLGGRWTRRGA